MSENEERELVILHRLWKWGFIKKYEIERYKELKEKHDHFYSQEKKAA